MKNIAIFASGAGSNARNIIEHLNGHGQMRVALVVSNKPGAGVLAIAEQHGVPTLVIERAGFYQTEALLDELTQHQIDFVVLAGFLWLIPGYLTHAFAQRMVNIHPALLPKYGGKGMYGMHVHEAVNAAGETETGITIHYVNDHYDEGDIVFQAATEVTATDMPTDIEKKVQILEYQHFPTVVEQLVLSL